MLGDVEMLWQHTLTPSLLFSWASGSSVGGYDDTSSDHSPANAADPPATSANSPATPSPAPTAAGTHASTGNCFLNSSSCSLLPKMFPGKEAARVSDLNFGAAMLWDELTALVFNSRNSYWKQNQGAVLGVFPRSAK